MSSTHARQFIAALAAVAGSSVLTATPAGASMPAPPPAAASAAALQVTARASTTAPEAGARFAVSGTTHPGSKAALQERIRGRWVGVGRAVSVPRSGKYSIPARASLIGGHSYRVVAALKGQTVASKSINVTVYGWLNLSELDSVAHPNLSVIEAVKINGRTYIHSLAAWKGNSFMESSGTWSVDRSCKRLRTTVGLNDTSREGSEAVVTIDRDQVNVHSETYGIGQSRLVNVDISGALRIKLTGVSTVKGNAVTTAFGTPQILCNKNLLE